MFWVGFANWSVSYAVTIAPCQWLELPSQQLRISQCLFDKEAREFLFYSSYATLSLHRLENKGYEGLPVQVSPGLLDYL